MKRGILIAILAVGLLVLLIGEQIYLDRTMDTVVAKSKELQAAIADNNQAKSLALTKQLEEFWKAQEPILTAILDHNEIEDIGKQINYVRGFIESEDLEIALIECKLLVYRASSSTMIFNFDFQNIL